jgi:Holliday junction resolvase RusA-like endonuclease
MVVIENLPSPISINAAYVNVRGKGRVRSKAYKAWAMHAGYVMAAQRPTRVKGPVAVVIFTTRDNARSDLDNRAKTLIDLLVTHGVIEDDRFIEKIIMAWSSEPGTRVKVIPQSWSTMPVPKKKAAIKPRGTAATKQVKK